MSAVEAAIARARQAFGLDAYSDAEDPAASAMRTRTSPYGSMRTMTRARLGRPLAHSTPGWREI